MCPRAPYPPSPLLIKPNAIHEIDLVGPRHLEGGVAFYALNAIDFARRRVAIEILSSKEEWEVAHGLIRLWRRLGVPRSAKFDNGQTIQGRGGGPGVDLSRARQGVSSRVPGRRYRRAHDGEETPCPPLSPITT